MSGMQEKKITDLHTVQYRPWTVVIHFSNTSSTRPKKENDAIKKLLISVA